MENYYQILINELNKVIGRLTIKKEKNETKSNSVNEEIQKLQKQIEELDKVIGNKTYILDVLQKFGNHLKRKWKNNILPKNVILLIITILPTIIFGGGMVLVNEMAIGSFLGCIAGCVLIDLLASGIISYAELKPLLQIKSKYQEDDIKQELKSLMEARNLKNGWLEECVTFDKKLTADHIILEDDLQKFTEYLDEVNYGLSLSKNLAKGETYSVNQIFNQDSKAQEILKRVREKVES